MDPLSIGIIGLVIMFILLFSGMPLGLAFGMVGFAGFAYVQGINGALGVLRTVPYSTFSDYNYTVIPLFVLMGCIAFYGRLSEDLYKSAYRLLGAMRGGLAMATIVACAIFSAVSGSSVATAATMGKVCLPEMKKYDYDDALATGCVAAGATMDILIPPSVILIIYGIIAEQSIGKLYMAGFIPGAIQALIFMILIYVMCWINPKLGPPGPKTGWNEKVRAMGSAWSAIVLFGLVMGGLYFGWFSANEAAGIGAFVALIIVLINRKLTWQGFKDALMDAVKTSAMIFLVIVGAMMFTYFLNVTGVSQEFTEFVVDLAISRYVVIAGMIVLYLILGAIMDEMGMIFLTVPVFLPVIVALGFDPIWFGIIVVLVCQCGAINPPVAINVFIIKGIAPEIPITTIYRGILPFSLTTIAIIILLIVFPEIVMFLPNTMK